MTSILKHPVITSPSSEQREGIRQLTLNRIYATAIEQAGGIILATGRPRDEEEIRAIAELSDGLLLTGGSDVCPELYKEERRHCNNINRERDELEVALVKQMLRLGKPVLGICRGMQVMNVALGGSLYQDIMQEMPNAIEHDFHFDKKGVALPRDFRAHEVIIASETLLGSIFKTTTSAVNSLHHQGVKTLGKGFVASAHTSDGLVEAIELPGYSFVLGVEWHPEELGDESSKKIFQSFIDAARKTK